jgi:hypothetical protein
LQGGEYQEGEEGVRYRIWAFAANRYWNGARPEWFWNWLSNVTFVSAYTEPPDDEEIPF